MVTIQCAHPPHHHNGFVVKCRLWTASGGVYALYIYIYIYVVDIYIYIYKYMVDKYIYIYIYIKWMAMRTLYLKTTGF